jgi:hypothetical protein
MEIAMFLDYKPTRELGKGFLHRDITGEMFFQVFQNTTIYSLFLF